MKFIELHAPRAAAERRAALMGIVNATPDSFSDGTGSQPSPDEIVERARLLVERGADILDVGAESTRPGFQFVSAEDEIARLVPAITAIRRAFPDISISADTRKGAVAAAALDAGADIVNDVSGLSDSDLVRTVVARGCGVVAMCGGPAFDSAETPPRKAECGSLVNEAAALRGKALSYGIAEDNLCIDPGFGFGLRHGANLVLRDAIAEIVRACAPCPVLVGASRKHFLADVYPELDPDSATARFHADCIAAGAAIVRAHAF